jgi:hypothetical protein
MVLRPVPCINNRDFIQVLIVLRYPLSRQAGKFVVVVAVWCRPAKRLELLNLLSLSQLVIHLLNLPNCKFKERRRRNGRKIQIIEMSC